MCADRLLWGYFASVAVMTAYGAPQPRHAHRPPKIVIGEPCLPARLTFYMRKFSLFWGVQSYLNSFPSRQMDGQTDSGFSERKTFPLRETFSREKTFFPSHRRSSSFRVLFESERNRMWHGIWDFKFKKSPIGRLLHQPQQTTTTIQQDELWECGGWLRWSKGTSLLFYSVVSLFYVFILSAAVLTIRSPKTRGFKYGFEFSCCDFLSEDSNSVRFVSNFFPRGKRMTDSIFPLSKNQILGRHKNYPQRGSMIFVKYLPRLFSLRTRI
jgi:hypothetical protein